MFWSISFFNMDIMFSSIRPRQVAIGVEILGPCGEIRLSGVSGTCMAQ